MSRAPLWQAVHRYAGQGTARFHTPGHSGRAGDALPSAFAGILPCDQTEIPGLDSLYESDGVIREAEDLAAELFGAQATLFSAGGCTLCIQTMLALAARSGEAVAMDRRSHRTAVHACALLDLDPVWLYPGPDGRIAPQTVQELLTRRPDIRAVYLTSPDYYGRLCDIGAIAAVCRLKGIPLLVDNAHGSHLAFLSPSLHPLHLGATMTADSAHKTLPVLTGGAMLQIGTHAYVAHAKSKMALFGSTSPSYPIMASLDLARAWLQETGAAAFAALAQKSRRLEEVCRRAGIPTVDGLRDPTRLTLYTGAIGVSGLRAASYFRERGCQAEHADDGYAVFILTPFQTDAELDRLAAAVADLPEYLHTEPSAQIGTGSYTLPAAEGVLSVREALFAVTERLPVMDAVGRIAAQAACPCPPGVPVVVPGEKISSEGAQILFQAGILSIEVVK